MNAMEHDKSIRLCRHTYSNSMDCIQYRLIGTKAEQISTFLTQELFLHPSIILWSLVLLYA